MSAPTVTVTAIAPSGGRSHGGYVVYLQGTLFRLPSAPPAGETDGKVPATVKIMIAGWDVGTVEVLSASRCRFIMPAYHGDDPHAFADGPVAVDLAFSNLDDNGAPITGQTVTKAHFFTYRQKDLTVESHSAAVDRVLLQSLAAGVIENVVFATSREWALPGTDLLIRVEEQAKTPVLYLSGPDEQEPGDAEREAETEINRRLKPTDAHVPQVLQPPSVRNFVYGVSGATGEKEDVLCRNLGQALIEHFKAVKFLDVPIDPASPSVKRQYPVKISRSGYPKYGKAGEMFQFTAQIVVEGVWIMAEDPVVLREGKMVEAGTDSDWAFGYPDQWIDIEREVA